MDIEIVVPGRQPREDETKHDGERDRQPPHLHEVHLTKKKKGGEYYLLVVVLGGGGDGVSPLTGSTESRGPGGGQQEGQKKLRACCRCWDLVGGMGSRWCHVTTNNAESSHQEMASLRWGCFCRARSVMHVPSSSGPIQQL